MSNQIQNPKGQRKYDLRARTARFGESVIRFVQTLPQNSINKPLISQLVRSATSIGANYMEADGADTKKDFSHKIGISKRESKESMHWLHMVAVANPDKKTKCRLHWKEAHELALIFSSINKKK